MTIIDRMRAKLDEALAAGHVALGWDVSHHAWTAIGHDKATHPGAVTHQPYTTEHSVFGIRVSVGLHHGQRDGNGWFLISRPADAPFEAPTRWGGTL